MKDELSIGNHKVVGCTCCRGTWACGRPGLGHQEREREGKEAIEIILLLQKVNWSCLKWRIEMNQSNSFRIIRDWMKLHTENEIRFSWNLEIVFCNERDNNRYTNSFFFIYFYVIMIVLVSPASGVIEPGTSLLLLFLNFDFERDNHSEDHLSGKLYLTSLLSSSRVAFSTTPSICPRGAIFPQFALVFLSQIESWRASCPPSTLVKNRLKIIWLRKACESFEFILSINPGRKNIFTPENR